MADDAKVKSLEKVKARADAAFGLLLLLALPTTLVVAIWSEDWRPALTALVALTVSGLYTLCVEKALKAARGG